MGARFGCRASRSPPAPPDRTKALAHHQISAQWRLDVGLRETTHWKMVYESAARAGSFGPNTADRPLRGGGATQRKPARDPTSRWLRRVGNRHLGTADPR
ncbi:hypothetical protein GCM10010425_22080 [Streptomyces spororaveus]